MARDLLIDLRFADVPQDLSTLKDCLDLLRRNMPGLLQAEKDRIWKEWNTGDEADRSVGSYLVKQLEDGLTTRFITGAFVIALWAVYEAGVVKYANHIRESKNLTIKLRDLRGDFLERARKYFEQVLLFDLHPATIDWIRIADIAKLRHVLAHANGRLDDIPEPDRKAIEQWAVRDSNLRIEDDNVVITFAFAEDAWLFLSSLLDDLQRRVRKSF